MAPFPTSFVDGTTSVSVLQPVPSQTEIEISLMMYQFNGRRIQWKTKESICSLACIKTEQVCFGELRNEKRRKVIPHNFDLINKPKSCKRLLKGTKIACFGSKVIYNIYKGPSQGLTLLVFKNANNVVSCQNCNTLLNVQYNNVHCTTVPSLLCEIHVEPLMVTDKCNEGCMCNTLSRHKL